MPSHLTHRWAPVLLLGALCLVVTVCPFWLWRLRFIRLVLKTGSCWEEGDRCVSVKSNKLKEIMLPAVQAEKRRYAKLQTADWWELAKTLLESLSLPLTTNKWQLQMTRGDYLGHSKRLSVKEHAMLPWLGFGFCFHIYRLLILVVKKRKIPTFLPKYFNLCSFLICTMKALKLYSRICQKKTPLFWLLAIV